MGVKVSPASTAIRPVTQTALVEVYSESMYASSTPGRTLNGMISSAEPSRITAAKPSAMMRAGVSCFLILLLSIGFAPCP